MTRPAYLETYEYDEDFDRDDEQSEFEVDCPAYWTGERWYCPDAGTEHCDFDCPHSG